jgi:hypothetical protein
MEVVVDPKMLLDERMLSLCLCGCGCIPSFSLGFVLADAESTDWISGGRNFQLASDTERNWWGGLRHFLISVFGRWPLSGTLKDGHREGERNEEAALWKQLVALINQ